MYGRFGVAELRQRESDTMTPTQPHIAPNGSYTVSQASALLAIDRRTLRRYEAAGLVVAHMNQLGKRKYMGEGLIKLWESNY